MVVLGARCRRRTDALTAMYMANGQAKSWSARVAVLAPYFWLTIFFLVPFLIVLKISVSQIAIAQPPYIPVFDLAGGLQGVKSFLRELTLGNYALLAGDPIYLFSYLKSLEIAV